MKTIIAALAASEAMAVAPVVVLHGVGDNCPGAQYYVDAIANSIDHQAVVKCVEIGNGTISSMFTRMKWQASIVCHKLHNDPDFAGKEINIVGLSQGGLIARTVVETCADLDVHTLYTFGAPHNGVSVYQKCNKWYCPLVNHVLGYLAEFAIV